MSFDLFLYIPADKKTDEKRIAKVFADFNLKKNKSGTEWEFYHPLVDVNFSVGLEKAEPGDATHLEGYKDFYYSVRINYLRPDSFGEFAFGYLEKVASSCGFAVCNPQDDDGSPKPYDTAYLLNQWKTTNCDLERNFRTNKFISLQIKHWNTMSFI